LEIRVYQNLALFFAAKLNIKSVVDASWLSTTVADAAAALIAAGYAGPTSPGSAPTKVDKDAVTAL